MKKLITLFFIFKLSFAFSQNYNDKIFTLAGDTIKCNITKISDVNIFYNIKSAKGDDNEHIYFSKVKNYCLDKNSKPKILVKHFGDNTAIPANIEDLNALIIKIDSIANIPFQFKNSYAINAEALLVRDIKFTYTHFLFKRSYLETMISYNFPFGKDQKTRDPFNDYGRIQLRLGLKNYYKRRSYISPMLLFGYGTFNNEWVSDRGFGVRNPTHPSWLVNRNKIESEILLKFGWTMHHKNIIHDIYYGLGFRYNILKDNLLEENINNTITYPAGKRTLPSGMIELHLGYQIGYWK